MRIENVPIHQLNCEHEKYMKLKEKKFDILYGFEIIAIKCVNCHKTLELRIKRITS